MTSGAATHLLTSPETEELYRAALSTLNGRRVPYMVGGTYALYHHAGITRPTKDFDVFVRPRDVARALGVLRRLGFQTELAFSHWLAKAFWGATFIDVIFNSGNGVAKVDDEWFAHAVDKEVLGVPVKLCPPEEMMWSKAFIMERERYDGADVAHMLRHCSPRLDWDRLVARFGAHYHVLLVHLVLFGFIYPGDRSLIPSRIIRQLMTRLHADLDASSHEPRVCQGTLLSRAQYLVDVDEYGYEDARLSPRGRLTLSEIAEWTAAIDVHRE
jgi:hypothetical protein